MNVRKDKRFKFKNPLKAIDSTSITLFLTLCSWASFRSAKAGIKAHTISGRHQKLAKSGNQHINNIYHFF
jgi:phage terminase small subunit